MQQKEVQTLKKSLKNVEDEDKKKEMKEYIQAFKNKETNKAIKDKEVSKLQQQKAENIKRMKEGKNPYYMKKCKFSHIPICNSAKLSFNLSIFIIATRKFLDLAEKYEELKSTGKLEKYLKKKRKKNTGRDKKAIPDS